MGGVRMEGTKGTGRSEAARRRGPLQDPEGEKKSPRRRGRGRGGAEGSALVEFAFAIVGGDVPVFSPPLAAMAPRWSAAVSACRELKPMPAARMNRRYRAKRNPSVAWWLLYSIPLELVAVQRLAGESQLPPAAPSCQ